MTHLLEARPDDRDTSDVGAVVDGAATTATYDVTWRDPGWDELLGEAARIGRDARFSDLSDAEVEDRLAVGAAQLDAALCRWLELLAELVVRQVWAHQGARTPAAWLSWRLGIAPSTAREQVRVALALRDFPTTRDRFAAGTLSYSKVRAITRCGRPSCEDLLLTWADDATAHRLEQVARAFRTAERAVHDADEVDDPVDRCTVRSRSVGVTSRELVITGPTERVVAIEDALRRLGEQSRDTRSSGDGHGGGALVEDQLEASPGGGAAGACETAQPRWRPVSAADQLDALEVALAAAETEHACDTTGADRHTLVLHASADDVGEAAAADAGDLAAFEISGHAAGVVAVHDDHARIRGMDRRTLRRLACDAGVVLVVTDRDGSPVDVGRRSRSTTAALRRALRRRDGGCTFPSCGQTRHLHAHHVRHWADGGPTDLGNLVLLCGFHHRFVHARDWGIQVRRDGRHRFRTADEAGVARVGARSAAPATAVARHAPRTASAEALLPRTYLGGPYDLDLAVAVLQQRHRLARDGTAVAA